MANEHPFQMLFETLGRLPIAHADLVNREAYQSLYDILSVPVEKTGRCILLRAPRAGHGKTHLLSRIQFHLGASHEFIPVHAAFGCRIDAASVIDDALRRLLRPLPASGGLCVLDLVSRRLFAMALQPLVGSGEVPCQDREGALMALRTRPIETFDFHHPNAVTAHWARENFEILGQRLSMEIAQRGGLPVREVAFWVETLFRFAATPLDQAVRLRSLADAVHQGNPGGGLQMDRLEALLGMLALLMRAVLVADDLEGFSSDESAALGLAAFLGSLRHSVERLDVILSLNQDVWDSAFLPRLSGGLADRLSEVVVELGPLSESEMIALLESRLPGLGSRVLERVDRSSAGTHARGVIREAGVAWLRASSSDVPSAPPPEPPATAPVVVSPDFMAETVTKPVDFDSKEPLLHPEIESGKVVESFAASEIAVPFVEKGTLGELEDLSRGVGEGIHDSETAVSWPIPEFASIEENADPSFVKTEEAESSPFSMQSPAIEAVPEFPGMEADSYAESPLAISNVSEPPISQMTSEYVDNPVFQAAPEPPAAPVFQSTPTAAATSVPEVYREETPAEPKVVDTDRVDDLLRQFRERYGRGSQ